MPPSPAIYQKPSTTARFAALLRAVAYLEEKEGDRGPDSLAHMFISPLARRVIRWKRLRHWLLGKVPPGTYEYVCARTRLFDKLFRQALKENYAQFVLLGAGYDSRAMRFEVGAEACRIFELDTPATLNRKASCWKRFNISPPENLIRVPIDFSIRRLSAVLRDAGYDTSRKTFFFWEGVSMYLDSLQMDAALALARSNSHMDSKLVFDYFYKSVVEGRSDAYGAMEQVEAVRKVGEPFRFGIEEGSIASFLASRGLQLIQHYLPAQLEDNYLKDTHGQCRGKIFACGGIALAAPGF